MALYLVMAVCLLGVCALLVAVRSELLQNMQELARRIDAAMEELQEAGRRTEERSDVCELLRWN